MDPKLYVAAADGDIHVLGQYNDIHLQLTPEKNTVLHVAAKFGQADCVMEIIGSHFSTLLQQPNKKGDTPLHLAARAGHLRVVKILIEAANKDTERGAASECKMMNGEKNTALHEAVRNHHRQVVKLLIQEDPEFVYGANAEGKTPLYIAAEWGFRDLVEMILDECKSPDHGGMKGRTALHAAVLLDDKGIYVVVESIHHSFLRRSPKI